MGSEFQSGEEDERLARVKNGIGRVGAASRSQAALHTKLIIFLSVTFLPILAAIVMSTQTTTQVYNIHYVWPGSQFVHNYWEVLTRWNFARLMLNTLGFALIVTFVSIGFSLLGALALVFYDFRYQRAVFVGILFVLLLPLPVRVVPLYDFIVRLGWHNTFHGLTIPALASATAIFLFRQHFQSLPVSLIEVARLDDVHPLVYLYKVLIPMSRGMIAGLTVIIFIASWNAYLWPLVVIRDQEKQLVQVGIRFLQAAEEGAFTQFELIMAGSILALVPPLLVLIVLRRPLLETFGVQ